MIREKLIKNIQKRMIQINLKEDRGKDIMRKDTKISLQEKRST